MSVSAEQRGKIPKPAPRDPKADEFRRERQAHVSTALASLRGDQDNMGDAAMGRIKQKFTSVLGRCEKELVRRLQQHSTSTSNPDLKSIVHEVLDVFNGLETAEREFGYLTDHVQYIEPVEHVFGELPAHTTDAEGFTYSAKKVKHSGFYVPMTRVIERLLQLDPAALEMVMVTQRKWFSERPPKGTSQKVYVDIDCAKLFEEHPELGRAQWGQPQGGRVKICIVMYYDGIEDWLNFVNLTWRAGCQHAKLDSRN